MTSITVFCGSKMGSDPAYAATAAALGRETAGRGIALVYGGGRLGLMGTLADAAVEAGGRVIGVIPRFLAKLEVEHDGLAELHQVGSMHERKNKMFELSDASVILPGGLGTLDEAMEIITWKQLQVHAKPVVVLNVAGYWEPLKALIDWTIENGFAHPKVRDLFTVVGTVEEVFPAIAKAPEPDIVVLNSHL